MHLNTMDISWSFFIWISLLLLLPLLLLLCFVVDKTKWDSYAEIYLGVKQGTKDLLVSGLDRESPT